MYRKILVAVDGSSTSDGALAAAVALARALSGRLRVPHAVDSPYDYPDVMYGHVPGDREELQEAWYKAGQEVFDWQAWGADLIVVGTNGRRGLSRLLLGSVAEGVARTATVPVLLVRAPQTKVSLPDRV